MINLKKKKEKVLGFEAQETRVTARLVPRDGALMEVGRVPWVSTASQDMEQLLVPFQIKKTEALLSATQMCIRGKLLYSWALNTPSPPAL